jgi:hypothetical protein
MKKTKLPIVFKWVSYPTPSEKEIMLDPELEDSLKEVDFNKNILDNYVVRNGYYYEGNGSFLFYYSGHLIYQINKEIEKYKHNENYSEYLKYLLSLANELQEKYREMESLEVKYFNEVCYLTNHVDRDMLKKFKENLDICYYPSKKETSGKKTIKLILSLKKYSLYRKIKYWLINGVKFLRRGLNVIFGL